MLVHRRLASLLSLSVLFLLRLSNVTAHGSDLITPSTTTVQEKVQQETIRPATLPPPSDEKAFTIDQNGINGTLMLRDLYADGHTLTNPASNAEVEVWVYDPNSKTARFAKRELIRTDQAGKFTLPASYLNEVSLMFLAHMDQRSSAMGIVHPKRRAVVGGAFECVYIESGAYRLVNTKHRGKRWVYREGNYAWQYGAELTRRDTFFFVDISSGSDTVSSFLDKAFPGLSRDLAQCDEDLVTKIGAVMKFLREDTKSTLYKPTEEVKKVDTELFSRCRASVGAPVKRWPTVEEYGAIWLKYGFIPVGNCTSCSLLAATLMYVVGVPPDKCFIEKLNYDSSWLYEHWILAVDVGGRWSPLDPQLAKNIVPKHPMQFTQGWWDDDLNRTLGKQFNWAMPFEAVLLPGSTLDRVPVVGDLPREFKAPR